MQKALHLMTRRFCQELHQVQLAQSARDGRPSGHAVGDDDHDHAADNDADAEDDGDDGDWVLLAMLACIRETCKASLRRLERGGERGGQRGGGSDGRPSSYNRAATMVKKTQQLWIASGGAFRYLPHVLASAAPQGAAPHARLCRGVLHTLQALVHNSRFAQQAGGER